MGTTSLKLHQCHHLVLESALWQSGHFGPVSAPGSVLDLLNLFASVGSSLPHLEQNRRVTIDKDLWLQMLAGAKCRL